MSEFTRHSHAGPGRGNRLTAPWRVLLRGVLAGCLLLAVAAGVQADEEGDGLQDPFMPPGWNESSAPAKTINTSAWTLESTLTSNGRRVAIINGRAVRAGDRVGGARVLSVDGGRARLEYDGYRFTIRSPVTRVRSDRESAQ